MIDDLRKRLLSVRQEYLLAHWQTLDAVAQTQLQRQLVAIDFDEFARLRAEHAEQHDDAAAIKKHWQEVAQQAQPPQAVRIGEEPAGITRRQWNSYRAGRHQGERHFD